MVVKNGPYFRMLGLKPEILHAQPIIIETYREAGRDVTWASGVDRTHSAGSLHYAGYALDVFWNDDQWGSAPGSTVANQLRERLGADYDAIKEANHIHVEYQPKKGINL